MNILINFLLLFVFPGISFSQDGQMKATVETMTNTFNFQGDTLAGATCFMIKKNNKDYFVTAAHLFKSSNNSGDEVSVRMLIQNQLELFNARVYFHKDRNVDIALLKLSEKVSQPIKVSETVFQSQGILSI